RAGALGGRVPTPRLGAGGLLGMERAVAGRPDRVCGADDLPGRDRAAHLHHQPAHHARRHPSLSAPLTPRRPAQLEVLGTSAVARRAAMAPRTTVALNSGVTSRRSTR